MVLKVSIAGIRGDVNVGLTPEVILNMSLAYGTYMKKGTIIIGSDTRPSRDMVKSNAISGLLATGCRVIDVGIAPTPVIAYMVKHLNADGGIVISASHNDIRYNALKMLKRDGIFLDNEEGTRIYDMYVNKKFNLASYSNISRIEKMKDASEIFIDSLFKSVSEYVDLENIREKKFKVVIDAVNGAGSVTNEIFFRKLGIKEVTYLNSDIEKPFPREPEPVKENLRSVEEELKQLDFDIAFVQDPDADRLGFFTPERGFISEELTLPLCILGVRERIETPVVINIATSLLNDHVLNGKSRLFRVPVGEANVSMKMWKEKSLIGGEGNGGVIFAPFHLGRDSYVGMLLLLHTLVQTGKSIDELVSEFPVFTMVKEKLLNVAITDETVKTIKEMFFRGKYRFDDGVYYTETDGEALWFLLRESNTEPIIRLQAEARSEKSARGVIKKIKGLF
ncbi:hypothetical protein KAJ26_01795 [bacterium]|nr:hypothetical protein [bacterium]